MPQGGLAQMLEQAGGEPDVIKAAKKIEKVRGGTETLFTVAAQAALDTGGGKKTTNKGLRLYCLGGKVEAAKGGSTRAAAERTRRAGRGDDEILMHVTPDEAKIIEGMWGKPQTNPNTGMPEYGFFKKAWKKVKKGVKKVVGSKVFGMVAPILLNMIPGIGTGLSIALQAGLGAMTAQARGEKPLLGAVSGAAAGAGSAIGKAASTAAEAGTLTLKQKIGAGVGKALAKGVEGAAKAGDVRAFAPGVVGSGIGQGLGAATQAFSPEAVQGIQAQQPGQKAGPLQKAASFLGLGATPEGVVRGDPSATLGSTLAGATLSPEGLTEAAGPPWMRALKRWGPMAGAGALALASGLGGGREEEGRPPGWAGRTSDDPDWGKSLPTYAMNRQFRGLPNVEDYFTYGQAGAPYSGQHLFMEPEPFGEEVPPDGSEGSEEYAGGLGAIGQQSDEEMRAGLYGPGMQRGGEFDYWEQNDDIGNAIPTVSAQGRYVKGPGTGRSDDIEARLSDGEYVMDAETVALLGDGSSDEGARRLDAMRSNLRKHKATKLSKGEFSHKAKEPAKYMNKVHGGKVKMKRKRTYEHGGVTNVAGASPVPPVRPQATGGRV